ncbi:MAG: alpha/beta hydrolase [Pseudomonas sp.]|nr:alpha/beta hydrolase [Pseudomonas sp.]
MSATEQRLLQVNGINLSVHSAGPAGGRVVWLLHGFPECWYSWRRQIGPLVAAGYQVFVPEMRGYGQSSAPQEVAAYDLLTLCADIQGAMDQLGHHEACVVGHDWGAPVAWHLALLEPERVKAVVAMSVPFAGRPRQPAIDSLRKHFAERFNYIVYFQTPGVAEAELDADIAHTLRLFMQGGANADLILKNKPASARLFDGVPVPTDLPHWCTADDFDVYLHTFAGRGFHGALNWYRNFERNWQRTEPLANAIVEQPALFLLGDQDPVGVLEAHTLKRMPERVPHLEQHLIAECGHWIQSEKPDEVNHFLLAFLARTYPQDSSR